MKNALILGLVAVCAVLMTSDSVMASSGGGKQKSRARILMRNVNPAGGATVAAWVRPPGTAFPTTVGQLRRNLIFIEPGATGRTANLRNGSYDVAIGNPAGLMGVADNVAVTPADIAAFATDQERIVVNGVDRRLDVSNFIVRTN